MTAEAAYVLAECLEALHQESECTQGHGNCGHTHCVDCCEAWPCNTIRVLRDFTGGPAA